MDSLIKTFLFLACCLPCRVEGYFYECLWGGYFTSIHVLIVDPKEHVIVPVRAVARETVATLAQRYGAIAAVNGGFWKLDGTPAGILKIAGEWHGIPTKPRGAIGWSDGGKHVLLDRVLMDTSFHQVIPATDHTAAEEWKNVEHIVGGAPLLISGGNLIEDYSAEEVLDAFLSNYHSRTAVGIRANGEWVEAPPSKFNASVHPRLCIKLCNPHFDSLRKIT